MWCMGFRSIFLELCCLLIKSMSTVGQRCQQWLALTECSHACTFGTRWFEKNRNLCVLVLAVPPTQQPNPNMCDWHITPTSAQPTSPIKMQHDWQIMEPTCCCFLWHLMHFDLQFNCSLNLRFFAQQVLSFVSNMPFLTHSGMSHLLSWVTRALELLEGHNFCRTRLMFASSFWVDAQGLTNGAKSSLDKSTSKKPSQCCDGVNCCRKLLCVFFVASRHVFVGCFTEGAARLAMQCTWNNFWCGLLKKQREGKCHVVMARASYQAILVFIVCTVLQ